jgi:polyhydroxyalkanoate synthesis regulator phasin
MLDEIRKGLLAGFGTVFITKDKIEEVTKKMVDQAKISKEDAQKLAEELLQTGEQRWSEMEKTVTEMTRKGMDSLDISRQSDLQDIKDKIDGLEKRLAAIEGAQKPDKVD